MKLSVTHTLTCTLPAPARAVEHLLLTPLPTPQQRVERWSIEMPGFAEAATFRDGYGNKAHLVSQTRPGEALVVRVTGSVETIDRAGVLGRLEYDPPSPIFRRPTAQTKPDAALIEGIDPSGGRIAMLHEIMGRVHERLSAEDEPDLAAAVHAFIAAARALDIPARYVTGYLFDDGKASFHAWAEACDDGLGWIGFDPTLNVCPTEQHIRLASGLDATGTMPVRIVPAWVEVPAEMVEIISG